MASVNHAVVANQFVKNYYMTFNTNPVALAGFYEEGSTLTLQGESFQGVQDIIDQLTSPPYQQCKHTIFDTDSQLSGPDSGVIVFVTGNLQLAGAEEGVTFCEMFHLLPSPGSPQGDYYVFNDIVRMNFA